MHEIQRRTFMNQFLGKLLQQLIVAKLVKNFPVSYGNRSFITAITSPPL